MSKHNLSEVIRVFNEHGPNSNEFVVHVTPYLRYLQGRLLGGVDEDFEQECLVRLLESFEYYDAECGINLASWIFAVVRNKASSWRSKQRRRGREVATEIQEETVPEPEQEDYGEIEEDMARWFFDGMRRLKVKLVTPSIVDDTYSLGMEHPITRSVLWDFNYNSRCDVIKERRKHDERFPF